MSYVEEADELRAELAVCRETNRRIHEQDTTNVAKLQAIQELCRRILDDETAKAIRPDGEDELADGILRITAIDTSGPA